MELWKVPGQRCGAGERLTRDGKVLRWEGVPSPDGKWVAHQDKDNRSGCSTSPPNPQNLWPPIPTTTIAAPFRIRALVPRQPLDSPTMPKLSICNPIMLYNMESAASPR